VAPVVPLGAPDVPKSNTIELSTAPVVHGIVIALVREVETLFKLPSPLNVIVPLATRPSGLPLISVGSRA
jgi:hypothetical protein